MEYRKLGRSGMYVSEIAYGNWMTHGEQIDQDAATECVRAALDLGITTFDTADAYAGTRAESALGEALQGVRREGLEIFTKVYFPTGEGKNDRGLSRKHIMESINGSLRRLRTDYVDLYQAHRYDYETPLEETMQAFADIVHAGKAHYIGVSEWTVEEIRAAHALATDLGIQLISNQPQYNMLWRVIEPEVVPVSEEVGLGQIVWSPIAQGVLTGKYAPGASTAPADSRFATEAGAVKDEHRYMQQSVLERVQELRPLAEEAGLSMAAFAVAWVLQNQNVSAAIVGASKPEQLKDNVTASGVTLSPELLARVDAVLVHPEAGDVVERDPSKVESRPERA
ncbi:aldo/keto reductase family protein [Sinomonas halotolerans]|uniref:Aldo/keto reductase family protein n=1 Tax=Sinomonas halotolerans TaxID=1644133 RepID=A0ABU9X1X8_9MICC